MKRKELPKGVSKKQSHYAQQLAELRGLRLLILSQKMLHEFQSSPS